MFSVRAIARLTPRALPRLTSSAIRRPAHKSLLQNALSPAKLRNAAAFSTATMRREKESEIDEELVAKLESEWEVEQQMDEDAGVGASVKDFLDNGPFEIEDTPGREEVALTRKFGDETIRVSFSTVDVAFDPEADYVDRALGDEETPVSEGQNQAEMEGSIGEESADAQQDSSYPVRMNIVIEKPEKGALVIETVAQDGLIAIDQVYYYSDASHAHDKTAQAAHERQSIYAGPQFGNLDEDLQLLFDKYLDERGINTDLALFAPNYIDLKEQKEYLRWLSNVKKFVVA